MKPTVALIGLDEPETAEIQARVDVAVIAHPMLPGLLLKDGQLMIESPRGLRYLPVSQVIYHGIFEDDHDFIAGLALWAGPCLPNARGMMDCRLKLPCLVRALQFTRFGDPLRSYALAGVTFESAIERVAKWGNWHCGENKERFSGAWTGAEPAIIEQFLPGQAVRLLVVGDQAWQIRLEGDDWLKSIHHDNASFMDLDADLLDDTRRIGAGFGLEIVANDYIISPDGTKHLLEVNHIPNVTRFPEIREAYLDYAVNWIRATTPVIESSN